MPCNFFADDVTYPNQINYYIVPDDTLIYDQPHVFFPRIDQPEWNHTCPFEKCGLSHGLRTYYAGDDIYGFPKDHVDGDFDDFNGRSLSTKYSVAGAPPVNPCVGVPAFKDAIVFAFTSTTIACECDTLGTFYGTLPLVLSCPDDPRFDGVRFDVPFQSGFLENIWYLETTFLGRSWFVEVFGPNESGEPCTLGVIMATMDVGDTIEVDGTQAGFTHCDPLNWTTTGEVNDPGPTGAIVTFTIAPA